jgi:nitroreductase
MSTFIENANWRYATKKFDASKKVSSEHLNILKEAIRLSASSYGLQPYKILIIENPELKAKLQPASYGQTQIVDASQVIVFANELNVGDTQIEAYVSNIIKTRGLTFDTVKGYSDYMKSAISNMPENVKNTWTAKQCYIALSNLLNAAAELKIDVTPMEGFVPEQYNEILGLDQLGLNAVVVATIGYRHLEDANQHIAKVRKSNEELFINL